MLEIPHLPEKHAALLDKARKAYLGEYADRWEGMKYEVAELVDYMKKFYRGFALVTLKVINQEG